jgi:hypothetical protein
VTIGYEGADLLTPFRTFEPWSKMIRGALTWHGYPDPLLSQERVDQEAKAEEPLKVLVDAWESAIGLDRWMTAAEILVTYENGGATEEGRELRDAMDQAIQCRGPMNARAIGRALGIAYARQKRGGRGFATKEGTRMDQYALTRGKDVYS